MATKRAVKKNTEWFYLLGAIALPFILLSLWHILDKTYPRGDEAMYFEVTQSIFDSFKEGMLKGLDALYFFRRQKAIFHPLLGLPALTLSLGSVAPAIAMYLCASFLLFNFFSYKIFRHYLPSIQAVIATMFLGCLSWVIHPYYAFSAESSFITVFTITLYYLVKSEAFTKHKDAIVFSALMGLSTIIRPMESFMVFFPLCIFVFTQACKNKSISYRDVIASLPPTVIAVALLFWSVMLKRALTPAETAECMVIWASTLGFYAAAVHFFKLERFFFYCAALFNSIVFIWFVPFFKDIYIWAFENSFGSAARGGGGREGISFFKFFYLELSFFGGWFLPLMVVIAAALAWRMDKKSKNTLKKIVQQQKWYVLAFATAIIFPFVMGGLSYSLDPRYYFAGALLLMFCFFILYLNPKLALLKFRTVLLIPMIAIQVLFIISNTLYAPWRSEVTDTLALSWPWAATWDPIVRKSDPTPAFYDQLRTAGIPRDANLGFLVSQDTDFIWLLNSWTFPILSHERGDHYTYWQVSQFSFKNIQEQLKFLNNCCEYALMGPMNSGSVMRSFLSSHKTSASKYTVLKKFSGKHFDESVHEYWVVKINK